LISHPFTVLAVTIIMGQAGIPIASAPALWADLYLTAGYLLPHHFRSDLCSFVSTSPGCVMLLTLGLTAAVSGARLTPEVD
jgi:hypothetical protein